MSYHNRGTNAEKSQEERFNTVNSPPLHQIKFSGRSPGLKVSTTKSYKAQWLTLILDLFTVAGAALALVLTAPNFPFNLQEEKAFHQDQKIELVILREKLINTMNLSIFCSENLLKSQKWQFYRMLY